jgi:curved DNA-binding protein CbpA
MGNSQSLNQYDPSHIRIYQKLLHISNPQTRVQMIQTLLAGAEYVQSARVAGIYSHLLAYVARVSAREQPPLLPGEETLRQLQAQQQQQQQQPQHNSIVARPNTKSKNLSPSAQVIKGRSNEKAMSYFQNCLLVLGLEEEVALTEQSLRTAYKKAAVITHPDKGGSEQAFEAVTRAFAYLTEILKRINGGRSTAGVVDAPTALKDSRQTESKDWEMVEPVRLNPKKLDVNAFNQMFEKTRMPDPDDEGYGDWLKQEGSASSGPTFGGKFNRDIFNQTFEDEAKKRGFSSTAMSVSVPQAMVLAPSQGVELGRGATGDYTAPANAQMKYTDLRNAYTTESAFSHQVANVQVENRSFDNYSSNRKKAPEPLGSAEMEAIQEAELYQAKREKERSLRAAHEMTMADAYFNKMKQLVLTEGPDTVRKSNRG